MNQESFDTAFEQITKAQKMVLKLFLVGKNDEAIAQTLHLDSSTIRRHIANICSIFGFKNQSGERFSYRQELIEIFTKFKPDLVGLDLHQEVAQILEFPDVQVPLNSRFYIERPPIESNCDREILLPGTLILIKAPKLMGKTSLLTRIIAHATQQDLRTVQLNMRLADRNNLTDLDRFLRAFCQIVSRELHLENRLDEFWDLELLSSNYNCTAYFEEYLLPQINSQLVIGLDEVDRLFDYPEIAGDFFGLLRLWHEKSKNFGIWQKLRLIVVHCTEVYVKLDANKSPFNVGFPITLPEFTPAQVTELALVHQLNWDRTQVSQLMQLVGGHPYLVRLAMYSLKVQNIDLDKLLATAATETGIYSSHLNRLTLNLQQNIQLFELFKSIVYNPMNIFKLDKIQVYKLHGMGAIKIVDNIVQPSCDLYRQYFYNSN